MADIVIKNGKVLDPLLGVFERKDVAIQNGRIASVSSRIEEDAVIVLDARDCIVSPGLIDFHVHVNREGSEHGIDGDLGLLPNGVTTAVDGGTCGVSNYRAFHNTTIVHSLLRLKSLINVSSTGLMSTLYDENVDPRFFDLDKLKRLFEEFSGEIVGLKLRTSKQIVGNMTSEPLEGALKIAEQMGCPLVVHVTNPSIDCGLIAKMLRPGDVFCHAYQGRNNTILDESGKVKSEVLQAHDRGVLFDACNGTWNYAFSVAKPAMEQGFLPDIISTDLSWSSFYKQPVISLPYVMSKYWNMGMQLTDIFDRTVLNPAKYLHMEQELATLQPGTVADVAIFREVKQHAVFYDCINEMLEGDRILVPQATIKGGKMMYRQTNFI